MPRVPRKTTPLGQLRVDSGKTLREFSELLDMPVRTLQSYMLGTRSLPPLESFTPIGSEWGVDLDSLIKGPPQMINGGPVSPDGIKNWKKYLALSEREAADAVSELSPILEAVLKGYSEVDPHRGRLLLTQICRVVNNAIETPKIRKAAETFLNLNQKEEERDYSSGEEFLKDVMELKQSKQWPKITAAIDRKDPVHLKIRTTRLLDLPWKFMEFENLGSAELGTAVDRAVLPVTIRKVKITYIITQGGFKFEVSRDQG